MKIKCHSCKNYMNKKIDKYHYRESGLDNVYLHNITIYECACGSKYPSLFRVGRLNESIAKALLEKRALLNGDEIRFLRKNIFFSSKDFSAALGIGNTTLSKWENEYQPHSEPNDRLIRNTYMIHKGINSKEAKKIIKNLSKTRLEESEIYYLIQAQLFQDDYIVIMKPIFESQTLKINRALIGMQISQASHAGIYGVWYGFSTIQTDRVFASDKLLDSGADSNILGIGDYLNAGQKA